MTTNVGVMGTHGMRTEDKVLRAALWGVQVLLAAIFCMTGIMKTTQSIVGLSAKMAWVTAVPPELVRFIGTAELAGAVGLILPAATRLAPRLTPFAAVGLATIMALAIPFHISRGEGNFIGINLILGGLAAFVAWGRFSKEPIAPRE